MVIEGRIIAIVVGIVIIIIEGVSFLTRTEPTASHTLLASPMTTTERTTTLRA
jgi:hypothetical protein